jgi:hypothetical protein
MKSDSFLRTTPMTRRRSSLSLLIVLGLLAACFGSQARADVVLDARIGFGQSAPGASRYRPGAWTPVTVYLSGQGARGVGQLTVTVHQSSHVTSYTRKVSLHDGPLNEAYNFVFDYRPINYGLMGGSAAPDISVQLVLDGRELAKKRFALPLAVNDESFNILALTRDGSGMNFLAKKKLALVHRGVNPNGLRSRFGGGQGNAVGTSYSALEPVTSSTLLYTDPRALPGIAQGYAMIDAVALADQPLDNLTEDQTEALRGYVRDGGLLVVSGGGDLARLKSQFYQEMLPVEPKTATAVRAGSPDLAALETRYRLPLDLKDSVALTIGTLKPGAYTLLGAAGATGFGLVAARPYGDGFVVFTAFDFLAPEFRGWKQTPALWRDILRCANQSVSPREVLSNQAHFGAQSGNKGLVDAMAGRQATSTPGFPVIATFLATYLILLVPGSYILLKKLDRRELAWFTAPCLVLGFTVVAYLIALSTKGSALTVNRVVVLEAQSNTDQVAAYGQMTLYSPRRAAYDIALGPPGDAGRAYHAVAPAEILEVSAANLGDMTVEHDQTTTIRGAEVRLWDKRSFDSPVLTSLGGSVEIKSSVGDGDHVLVTVTNKTKYPLQDCALVDSKGDSIPLGNLAPGQTQTAGRRLAWQNRETTATVHLPPAPADWKSTSTVNNRRPETPEQVRNSLRFALIEAMDGTNTAYPSYPNYAMMNGEEDAQSFGRASNAFVAWVDNGGHPLFDPHVDGKAAAGQEADLLYIHLLPPAGLSRQVARAVNPFLQDPVLNLKEEASGPAGRILP